jgi:hypothetical protein
VSKENLTDVMNLRISAEEKQKFMDLCGQYGITSYGMLREMVQAFNDGNLRIVVPENHLRILKGVHTHVA